MPNEPNRTWYDDNPMVRLFCAVAKLSADDYRKAFRDMLNGKQLSNEQQRNFDESELFFRSETFSEMLELDGDYIMDQIVKEERKRKRGKSNAVCA